VSEFLDVTMRIVVDVLRFDRALLMLADGDQLVYAHSAGTDPAVLERIKRYRVPLSRDANVMVRVFKSGKPVMVEDVEKSGLNPDNLILASGRPVSFCLCPLIGVDDRPLGVLGADRTRREPLKRSDLDTLSVFANSMAAFLRRAQLDEKVAEIGTASGRFVPRELLEHLGRGSIVDVRLGDQVQKEMSVLFSDIRSFTSLSETMTPRENFNFLNSYLSRVSPLIRKHHGFIDKYLGDGIMALFPGAEDAVKAAIEIVRYLPVYNGHRQKSGYKSIRIGNGIHSGSLMLGTIGEEARMEGTVIADAVNLASRLENLTKVYGGSIVVSEQGLFGLSDPNAYNWRFLGKVRVKGKRNLVSVFEIFDGDEEESIQLKASTREVFERAVHFFHSGEFRDSQMLLARVLSTNPGDQAAALLAAHAQRYADHGSPPDWDGGLEMGIA
jgi:class 3 adenylate cyclase